ncbi:LolA family protein [Salarchaeum sp. III]|uniref:LolA family protein n=1 Tax=Salarchaeum sp. III TaxID=3107927 RepID=UPI002ED867EA
MGRHVVGRTGLLVGLVLVLVTLAGCGGLQTAEDIPTGDEARTGYAELDGVAGTVEYRYNSTETSSVTRASVITRPDAGVTRREILAPAQLTGDITVTNGSVYWRYDASANTATRTSLGASGPVNTSNAGFVRSVFANLTSSGTGSLVADPALPVGPLNINGEEGSQTAIEFMGETKFDVEYAGTETVAGRQTHVVELGHVNATGDGLSTYVENATYWFDAEYFLPLKVTTTLSIDGERTRAIKRYTNVTFPGDLGSERFQFTPPANATVETQSVPRPATFETAAAAARRVSFDVATPTVPPGYDLETARVSQFQNRTTVSLTYENATSEFSVVTRNPPISALDGRTVSLGPVNATTVTVDDITVYRWQCSGVEYTVRGNLSTGGVQEIARDAATACPEASGAS